MKKLVEYNYVIAAISDVSIVLCVQNETRNQVCNKVRFQILLYIFYSPWKHKETQGFLKFSGEIEIWFVWFLTL